MLEKYPADSAVYDIDCSELLAEAETITGTPTMSFEPSTLAGTDRLTFASIQVNAVPITYTNKDGTTRTVPVGKVIQVTISGGTARSTLDRRRYSVLAAFTTSSSQTLTAKAFLEVIPTSPEYSQHL